jgi:filamentous hemagglutinin family protein
LSYTRTLVSLVIEKDQAMKPTRSTSSLPGLRTLSAALAPSFCTLAGMASLPLLMSPAAWAQAIQADGRTLTTVSTAGAVTDIRTGTIAGNSGFNSFNTFSVNSGHTANLHVPSGAVNLVNIVRDARSDIHGTLNAIRDGRIGGNVFFANPHGFVVGAGGVVNVGSLSVSTPTQSFADRFFVNGQPDAGAVGQLLNGTAPLSSAAIRIDGQINAADGVTLAAGTVSVAGAVLTGARFEGRAPDFTDIVNTQGVSTGSRLVERSGRIYIAADEDIEIAGTLDARGGGADGGEIELKAGRDILVDIDAMVTAAGDGEGSDGGRVYSMAERSALIRSGAVMDASAGASGDGGFVEFSAKDTVELAGGQFLADGRAGGAAGLVLIDPLNIVLSANLLRGAGGYAGIPAGPDNGVSVTGANLLLQATNRITVNENVTVSSRRVAGTDAASHATGASVGPSGDITFEAKHIDLKSGSKVLAHADGDFAPFGGDIQLLATDNQSTPVLGSVDDSIASITVTNATIKGRDVTLKAEANDKWVWTGEEYTDALLEFLDDLALVVDATVSVAHATIDVDGGARIESSGDLKIESVAVTDASMRVVGSVLGIGYGETDALATVDIRRATLSSGGAMTLRSQADSTLLVKVDTINTGHYNNMLSTASEYANFAFAVGIANQRAETSVGSAAVIEKAASLAVEATGAKSIEVSATGSSFRDGMASSGIAVLVNDTTLTASLGGTVTDAGSVSVTASLADDAQTSVGASAGTAGDPNPEEGFSNARPIDVALFEKLTAFVADVPNKDARAGSSGNFGLSASFAWVDNDNAVKAEIAGGANVTSRGRVDVFANAEESLSFETSAAVDERSLEAPDPDHPLPPDEQKAKTEEKKKIAISGSIAVIDVTHRTDALIGDGATVNAAGAITVAADTKLTPFWTQWVDAYDTLDAMDWADPDAWTNLGSNLFDLIGQPINATSWVQSGVESERLSFAGAVDYFTLDSQANAKIGSAQINAGTAPLSAAQDVTVSAHASHGLLNLAGVPEIDLTTLPDGGSNSASAGFGGTYHHLTLTGGSDASIARGATVRADGLALLAETDFDQVTIAEAAGKAGKVSVQGAFSLIDSDLHTTAQIASGTTVNARDVVLQAIDNSMSINVAGGVARSGSIGIGFSIALNDLDRDTHALIGNRADETGTGGTLAASGNVFLKARAGATQGAFAVAGSLPGGGDESTDGKPGGDGSKTNVKDKGEQGKSGIGISAAVSINLVNDTTSATVADLASVSVAGTAASTLDINTDADGVTDLSVALTHGLNAGARNDALALAGAGALTIATGKTAGLGGAFTWNQLEKITQATIARTTLTFGGSGNVLLDAWNGGPMWSVSAGVAAGQKVGVAGSVAYSNVDNSTRVSIDGAGVDTGGTVSLISSDSSDIRSVAGAASYGGKAGFGAAVAISTVDSDTVAELVGDDTDVDDEVVRGAGGITASATSDNDIVSVAAALSASNGVSLSGAVTINTITNETRASADGVVLKSGGAIALSASDLSTIESLAGAVGFSLSTAGVGVAVAYNEIGNTTRVALEDALVEDQTGETVNTLTLTATNTSTIKSASVAGGLASTFGGAGSASTNFSDQTRTTAEIVDSDVAAAEANVTVTATDTSLIESLAGGVGLGLSAGFGAAVAVNDIGNATLARVSGKQTAGGLDVASVVISADSLATIKTASVGVGAGVKVGVGGSVAVNLISSDTRALIENSAVIEARDDVAVLAETDDRISVLAGAAGIGLAAAGVGASVTVNEITGTTEAAIRGSEVAARAQQGTGVSVNDGEVAGANLRDSIDEMNTEGGGYSSGNPFVAPDLTASRGKVNVRGIAVNALATHHTSTGVANVAGGLYAGVALTASASVIGGETLATVSDSVLNGGDNSGASALQAVSIRAADHAYGNTFIGSIAIGAAGIGASADVNVFQRNTIAKVTGGDTRRADITAKGDADIDALSAQGVASVVVGASGGVVAVVGSGSVAKFTSTTEAYAQAADFEVGSLDVTSQHFSTFLVAGGGLAVGGVAGAGTFAVGLDDSTTRARIEDVTVDTAGAVNVTAGTTTEMRTWAVGGAGGGFAGVAGAVAVGIIGSTTEASVIDSGIGSTADRAGSLLVSASDSVVTESRAGAAALGGLAGVGAGASVTKVDNTTSATIRDSNVYVSGDIDVTSQAERKLSNLAAAAAAGGTLGIGGSAAVTLLNATMNADASGELDNTDGDNEGTLSSAQAFSNRDLLSTDEDDGNVRTADSFSETDIERVNAAGKVATKDQVNAAPLGATLATVVDSDGTRDSLLAGGNIRIGASEKDRVEVGAGGIALGGLAGVGASVGVLEVRHNVGASTAGAISLQADTGDIELTAEAGELPDTDPLVQAEPALQVDSFQAAGGLVGVGAAVATVDLNNTVRASLGAGARATVSSATGDVRVTANDTLDARAKAEGYAVGVVAAGIVIAHADKTGSTTAQIGGLDTATAQTAATGVTLAGGLLDVRATREDTVAAESKAGAGGVAAGSGSESRAGALGSANAAVADRVTINGAGSAVSVSANSTPQVSAVARGYNGSLAVSIGLSLAEASASTQTFATVGRYNSITAGALSLNAATLLPSVVTSVGTSVGHSAYSYANATGGSLLVSANGSDSRARGNALVNATMGTGNVLAIADSTSLTASNLTRQTAVTSGVTLGGLLALGGNQAYAVAGSVTLASIDNGNTGTVGDALSVVATGHDETSADAAAGSGGIIAGAAALASTRNLSDTQALLGGGTAGDALVTDTGGRMEVSADHTASFNARVDSLSAGVVGASGAQARNDIDAKVVAGIRAGAHLNTWDMDVHALNQSRKPWLAQFNVVAGAGGLAGGAAGSGETRVDNITRVEVGDNARVRVLGDPDDAGRTSFNAVSDVMLRDRAKLEAGGAISAADAESIIEVNINPLTTAAGDVGRTEARVGSNVVIDTVGDFNLAARENVDVEARASSKTWGLAAYADGYSKSDIHSRSATSIGAGSDIRADGFINLGAGRDAGGVRNRYSSVAHTDLYNNSLVPIPGLDWGADGLLTQTNRIIVDGSLRSVKDVSLIADKGFGHIVNGHGVARDLYSQAASAIASGISNLFGGGDVSIEQNSGRSIELSQAGATVNGFIDAGIHNQRWMTISETDPGGGALPVTLSTQVPRDGQEAKCQAPGVAGCVYDTYSKQYWISRSDGLDMPVARIENLQDNLQTRIDSLKNIRGQYQGVTSTGADASSPETVAALTAEINFLEQQLADLFPAGGATASVSDAAFIILPELSARGGNINVMGDYLAGSGQLVARGDAKIQIINNSSAFLRTDALTIPEDATGRLVLNSVAILNTSGTRPTTADINAALNARNKGGSAGFGSVDIAPDSAVPLIEVRNTHIPLDADTRAPDIEVVGDISNLLGTVTLESERGSVLVQPKDPSNPLTAPNIQAATINITAGRDFVFSSPSAFYHTAGAARDLWGGTRTPSGGSGGTANNFEDSSLFSGAADDVRIGNGAPTIAGNNIFISARYLNINGLLQSGIPDRSITIDADARVNLNIGPYKTATTLAQAKTNYDALVAGGMKPADPRFRITGTDGNIVAFFNAELNRIELEPVKVEGGKLELLGEILNTGGGRIAAMDGYGRFDIDNLTGYDIVISGLDTGNDIEGRVRITDYLRRWDPAANGGLGAIVSSPVQSSTQTSAYYNSLTPVTRVVTRLGADVQTTDVIMTTESTPAGDKLVERPVGFYADLTDTRSTGYAPVEDQTYTWVTGQRSTTNTYARYEKETKFWFFPGSWSIADRTAYVEYPDTTPLMEGEYTRLDQTLGDDAYRYQRRDVTTSFRQWSTERSKCSWFFCIWKWHTYEVWSDFGTKRYNTHTVKADHLIPISFIGHDTGGIDIASRGGIILAGSLTNRTGLISLDATAGNGLPGGAIASESARGTVTTESLTMRAARGIGSATAPLSLNLLGNGSIDAVSAAGDVGLLAVSGDMRVAQAITGTDGRVFLQADGDIVSAGVGDAVRVQGGGVELVSLNGRIGSDTQALVVQTQATLQGGLDVTAMGDIDVLQPDGDLQLDKVESLTGDVTLTAGTGRIVDGNRNETRDTRAEAELDAVWKNLRLRESDGAADSLADALKAHRAGVDREYREYWSLRNVQLIEDPANAGSYVYRADAYDAAAAPQRLRDLHDKLGGLGVTLATGSVPDYDADFQYVGSVDTDRTLADISNGTHAWTDNQVRYGVSAAIYNKSVSDTETRIEQPNVVGRHIVLNAAGTAGGVGRDEGQFTVSIAALATLDPDQRRALAAAEADDVAVDTVAKTATVLKRDDVDVSTTADGSVTVNARGHVFLGADDYERNGTALPGDINLVSLDASGGGADYSKTIRLKVSGGIIDAGAGAVPNLRGGSTILEASHGSIGSAARPVSLDLGTAATLTARAASGIWLNELNGPMRVAEMFASAGGIHLTSAGSILDARGAQRVVALQTGDGDIDLRSIAGSIGAPGEALVVAPGNGHAVNADAAEDVHLSGITAADPDFSPDLEVGDVKAGGDASVTAIGTISGGSVRAVRGNLDLRAGQSVTVLEATADAGNASVFAEQDILMDAVTAGQGVRLETINGRVSVKRLSGDTIEIITDGDIESGTLKVDSQLSIGVGSITARIVQTGTSGPLLMNVTGPGGGMARWVDLTFDSPIGTRFERLYSQDARIETERGWLEVLDGRIDNQARFINPQSNVYMDNVTTVIEPADIQLNAPDGQFALRLERYRLVTDETALTRSPLHEVVNATDPDNSGREESRNAIEGRVPNPTRPQAVNVVPALSQIAINIPLDIPAVNSGDEETEEEAEARRGAEEEAGNETPKETAQ